MALGTITADKIIANWSDETVLSNSLGNTCHMTQPENCKAQTLGEMFAVTEHNSDLFDKLDNSKSNELIPGENWKFNKDTLMIYSDLYWKGFYGRDTDIMTTGLRAFGGFYKRFRRLNDDT
jgi:hypothetical protein